MLLAAILAPFARFVPFFFFGTFTITFTASAGAISMPGR